MLSRQPGALSIFGMKTRVQLRSNYCLTILVVLTVEMKRGSIFPRLQMLESNKAPRGRHCRLVRWAVHVGELRCWAPNDITPTRVQHRGLGYPHPGASPLLAAQTKITKPVSREMTNGRLGAPNMWDADFAPIKRPTPRCTFGREEGGHPHLDNGASCATSPARYAVSTGFSLGTATGHRHPYALLSAQLPAPRLTILL